MFRRLFLFAIGAALIGALLVSWLFWFGGGSSKATTIMVEEGATLGSLCPGLERKDLIPGNCTTYRAMARVLGSHDPIQAGEFEVPVRTGGAALLDLLDMLGRRDVFRQGSADPPDRIAHLAADRFMRANRALLVTDILARKLVPGLSHPELVGRELGGVHAVHQVFLGRDTLAHLDRIATAPAVHPLVAGIVKHAKHAILNAGLAGGARKRLELLCGLPAQLEPLDIRGMLFG